MNRPAMKASGKTGRASGLMVLGAVLIGTNGLMVFLAGTPPTISAFWRMFLSGVLLLALCRLSGRWRPLPLRSWLWSLLPAAAFAADLWFWHRSILMVGPGVATLLTNTQVFFMALAGLVLYRERLGGRFLAVSLLAFFGLWLLLGSGPVQRGPDHGWGVALGIASALCYTVYNLGLKRSLQDAADSGQTVSALQTLAMVSIGSAVMLGIAGMVEGVDFLPPSRASFGWLLLLAVLGHCLSWGLISTAIPHLRVAMVGLILMVQPIVSYLLDVALLGVNPTPVEWTGLGLSLAGILLAGLKRRNKVQPET
jgi:drug/metabolite transporter (DMT)-like permease